MHNWPGSLQPWDLSQPIGYGPCSSAHSIDRYLASRDVDTLPALTSDFGVNPNETFDVSDPALEEFGAHDVGLCAGSSHVQEPISSDRPNFEKPERTIGDFFRRNPDVDISDPGLLSFSEANLDFNSSLDHGYQNPSFPFLNQRHTTEDFPLANSINPFPVPGGITHFDLAEPSRAFYSSSTTLDDLFPNLPSSGSEPTQPTSPSMPSQADLHPPKCLLQPPGRTANFRCSVCTSSFALRAQFRYVS